MALVGRKRLVSRQHVLEREHGSGREAAVGQQIACPRKGAWFWSLGSGGAADSMSSEGSMVLVVRERWASRWHVHGREHGSGRGVKQVIMRRGKQAQA